MKRRDFLKMCGVAVGCPGLLASKSKAIIGHNPSVINVKGEVIIPRIHVFSGIKKDGMVRRFLDGEEIVGNKIVVVGCVDIELMDGEVFMKVVNER